MVVDFHVHCFPDELAERAVSTLGGRVGIKPWTDGTVGCIKKSMKKAGVDCSVVLSIATKPSQTSRINDWTAEIQGEGIIAFGSIHPDYDNWKDEVDKLVGAGIKGLKFHPDYQEFFVDDTKLYPIYEYAAQKGLILLFHAGVDIGLPPPYHCTPQRLSKVVEAFPGSRIVAAHMGGYDSWDEVEKYLVGRDLYFDTSYSLKKLGAERSRKLISEHGYEKILFATDSPWTDQKAGISAVKALGLDKNAEIAVLGGNACRLLGIR